MTYDCFYRILSKLPLDTPHQTFRNKKPVELIVEGKLRDLIVELHRLREGQPL